MSYLEILQSHNTRLQNAVDKANALPESGSGGVETCTVTINAVPMVTGTSNNLMSDIMLMRVNENGNIYQYEFTAYSYPVSVTNVLGDSYIIILIDGTYNFHEITTHLEDTGYADLIVMKTPVSIIGLYECNTNSNIFIEIDYI